MAVGDVVPGEAAATAPSPRAVWQSHRLGAPAGRLVALVLILAAFGLNLRTAIDLGLDRRPPSWTMAWVPAAISDLYFGGPGDYTGLVVVRDAFESKLSGPDSYNEAIRRTIAETPRSSTSRETHLLGTDDKGTLDFVKLAFRLFGPNVEGLLYTYFAILGISVLLFVVRFWRYPWTLALLAAYLVAHDAVMPVAPINPQLQGILLARFISVLAMIAFVQVALEMGEAWIGWARWPGAILTPGQVGLIIFVVHLSSRTAWAILAATLVGGLLVILTPPRLRWAAARIVPWRPAASQDLRPAWLPLLALWPVAALWAGNVSLTLYRQQAFAPVYFSDQGATHVFWHSLFSGLSTHPDLAREYDIRIDDVSVVAATGRYLVAEGRRGDWVAIGGESPGFSRVKYGPYDQYAGEAFRAACRRDPGGCAAAVLYYKPLVLGRYLAWFTGWWPEIPAPYMFDRELLEQYQPMARAMREERQIVDLGRPARLIVMALVGLALAGSLLAHYRVLLLTLVVLVGAASLPSLVAYPIAHTINDALVAAATAVYAVLALVVAALAGGVGRLVGWNSRT